MGADLPIHVQVPGYSVRDNQLYAADINVARVASAYQHPIYLYFRSLIATRTKELRDSLPSGVEVHYAVKANPMQEVVDFLASRTDGLDVASAGELHIALKSGIDSRKISMAGPGKSHDDLTTAIRSGINLIAESHKELDRIAEIGGQTGLIPRVAIRVNPNFELKASGMKMAGGPKPFGIDAEKVPDILASVGRSSVRFVGFHIFCGSQNLRADAICESQTRSVDLALSLARMAPSSLEWINLGGGFGIPYFPGDQRLDLAPISRNLRVLQDKVNRTLPGTSLVLELGRYLVGEAGLYLCSVTDKKISRDQLFLILNGGMHHHLSASGNFGQVIRKNYPVAVANRVTASEESIATAVGPLCTPLDVLAHRMALGHAEIGDTIAVFQSGAYGLSASPINFLGQPYPKELII